MKSSKREKKSSARMVLVAIGLILLVGSGAVIGKFQRRTLQELSERQLSYSEELGTLTELAQLVRDSDSLLQDAEKHATALESMLPTEMNFASFYERLESLTRANEIKLEGIQPGTVDDKESFSRMSVTISGSGTYSSIPSLLEGIGKSSRFTRFESLSVTPMNEAGSCRIVMTLSIFAQAKEGADA